MNGSDLEQIFAYQLRCQGAHWPTPVREHMFLPGRKWRFDFAWPDVKVAVEVDGGVWSQGRHTRGAGFVNDMEKFNEAAIAGWLVLRLSEKHLDDLSGLRWLERALHGRTAA